jgi:hypothetical protein
MRAVVAVGNRVLGRFPRSGGRVLCVHGSGSVHSRLSVFRITQQARFPRCPLCSCPVCGLADRLPSDTSLGRPRTADSADALRLLNHRTSSNALRRAAPSSAALRPAVRVGTYFVRVFPAGQAASGSTAHGGDRHGPCRGTRDAGARRRSAYRRLPVAGSRCRLSDSSAPGTSWESARLCWPPLECPSSFGS